MKRLSALTALCVMVALLAASEAPAAGAVPGAGRGGYTGVARGAEAAASAAKGGVPREGACYVPGQVLVRYEEGMDAYAGGTLSRIGASSLGRLTDAGLELLDVGGVGVDRALAVLRAQPSVRYAEPNYLRSPGATHPDDPWYAGTPPAPGPMQWNLREAPSSGGIDMPRAWDKTHGSASVVVAVLDTGVAYRNGGGYARAPDLTGKFRQGYDFINNDPYADDDHGHGTHVCGTVAQATNNGLDCAGIAHRTTVMPVKVLDRTGYGDDARIIQGIEFAADHGADVISMSFGGPDPSLALQEAVDYAFGRDVVLCAAAGNANLGTVEYPAAYPACVAVGATNRSKARASYSNYGAALDVVAPGGDSSGAIYQVTFKVRSQPSGGFAVGGMRGTSMATSHVSAVAALVKALHPSWSAPDVRGAIASSCFDLRPAGWDRHTGWGLLDAGAAVRAPRPSPRAPDPRSILPAHADAGTGARVTVEGSGFSSRVKVVLDRICEAPRAASWAVASGGNRVSCGLELAGVQPGLWDLVVENDTLREGRLEGGFCVDSADGGTWYLAEGSTGHGFEEFILIQNPSDSAARVNVELMAAGSGVPGVVATVQPGSRLTIRVNDVAPDRDLSAKVTSDQDIVCERAMYWSGRAEGTDSIGVRAPSYSWFLAEGSTAHGFETYVLIQNPDGRPATVELVYMTPAGPVPREAFSVPGGSRYTVSVGDDLPSSDVSVVVVANRRVVCERSMYWDGRRGGHVSTGTELPSVKWYLAEGSTGWGFDEYVLVENPGRTDARVTLTCMTPGGAVPRPPVVVPANTRATFHLNAALHGEDVSVEVTSDVGVVVERSMYWDRGTGKAGHNQVGVPQARRQCFLAEGSTGWGFDEWLLIQNPNPDPADVGIEYMTSSGPRPKDVFVLPANSRVSVHVNADVPGVDTSARVFSNLPVIAERSMYWHGGNAGHCSTGLMR